MYRRDARCGNSYAILWAASASGCSEDHASFAIRTLCSSVKYGGNVNAFHYRGKAVCTALHVAAAHGNRTFVEVLLENHANVDAYSLRLWKFLRTGLFRAEMNRATILKEFAKRTKLKNYCWLPLLPAMLRDSPYVAESLLQRQCSYHLALHCRNIFSPSLLKRPDMTEGYTVHHFLVDEGGFPASRSKIFHHFKDGVAIPERKSRMTPLMKSIQKADERSTETLISLSQKFDVTSATGWPALSYAVEGVSTFDTPKKRDWSASIVRQLLEKGANPNIGRPLQPLELAVTRLLEHTTDPGRAKQMRETILELLEHHADTNSQMSSGMTVGQFLYLEIEKKPTLTALRSLLKEFLGKGMRTNILFPDGTSILWRALNSNDLKRTIPTVLLKHGAHLTTAECDNLLLVWAGKKEKLHNDVEAQLSTFAVKCSQDTVNAAYSQIISNNDAAKYGDLINWRAATNMNVLVAKAIRHGFSRRHDLFGRAFDPNWQNKNMKSYAHIIIDVACDGPYNEAVPMEDLRILQKRGMSLQLKDRDGLTAFQSLNRQREGWEGSDPFGKLQRQMGFDLLAETGMT
ncbi:hypothetical protein PWT90_07754 [Aphanocladium album]|nr:hypothetical protein PWT90_07754 [Aphanocladium album]